MSLQVNARVRIRANNGYDDPNTTPTYAFAGETGVVTGIELEVGGSPVCYSIRLDNQAKHDFLSSGDKELTWPFYEDELETIDA